MVVVDWLVGPIMVNHEVPAAEHVTVDVPGLEERLVFRIALKFGFGFGFDPSLYKGC